MITGNSRTAEKLLISCIYKHAYININTILDIFNTHIYNLFITVCYEIWLEIIL